MKTRQTHSAVLLWALAFGMSLLSSGCSLRTMAVNALGDALATGSSAYGTDDDPKLVGQALPFALKTIEGLLAESPRHRGLLLAAASGFTQYSYAFVQSEADYIEASDVTLATAERGRAVRLYLRARGYGIRGLEVGTPGFEHALRQEPAAALALLRPEDAGLLYWVAASWGAAISLAKDDPELTADLHLVGMLAERALVLDEGYGDGVVHDLMVAYEGGRPAAAGGSVERARAHLERSLARARGGRAAPYVTFAETVSISTQNRDEFEQLLEAALALDPDRVPEQRLANLVAQRRARWLLGRTEELFLE